MPAGACPDYPLQASDCCCQCPAPQGLQEAQVLPTHQLLTLPVCCQQPLQLLEAASLKGHHDKLPTGTQSWLVQL